MTAACQYLGQPTGRRAKVRCAQIGGGATQVATEYECLHPRRQLPANGRRSQARGLPCLPTWPGPWLLPEQAVEAAALALCRECALYERVLAPQESGD